MFYDGDLQSGIALALQHAKFVACFVRDDGDESTRWENEFLADDAVKELMATKTVLLRLQAGSQEAGYLSAIFPVPKTPTLVIIHNGQLKEYLVSGTSQDDFTKRLKIALGTVDVSDETPPTASASAESVPTSAPAPGDDDLYGDDDPSAPTAISAATELPEAVPTTLPEPESVPTRSTPKPSAAAKGKAKEASADPVDDAKRAADVKHALQQKKLREDAKAERARILKRVEDDKVERKKREAARKAEVAREREQAATSAAGVSPMPTSTTPGRECALQIRLFDGATIRSRFAATATLQRDVRPWIESTAPAAADAPYTFKQVLTPQPNRSITVSEEEESLANIGLTPSATLILVAVREFAEAYEHPGYVSLGLTTGYGLVSSGFGLVSGVLGSFLGGRAQDGQSSSDASSTPARESARVRTLRDGPGDDHQLYNGNALNFEPRREEDKEN